MSRVSGSQKYFQKLLSHYTGIFTKGFSAQSFCILSQVFYFVDVVKFTDVSYEKFGPEEDNSFAETVEAV
jgi:hypothetical protein